MQPHSHVRVHLGNLRSNLEAIRKLIGPDRKMLVPVKGNAYGHGAVEVARLAASAGVDWLGVATVEEGLELRDAGLTLPILLLSPVLPDAQEAAVQSGLALTVSHPAQAAALQEACMRLGRKAEVHLELETGMGRTGVPLDEAVLAAAFIQEHCPRLHLDGASTHLPVSDGDDRDYTRAQIARFAGGVSRVEAALGRSLSLVHCANSGGLLGYPESLFTMVRPGISVYGLYDGASPVPGIEFRPVLSLLTKLVFVKRVAKGETVGYGRTWTAERDTWIGTLSCGYADGVNRLLSNRGRALVRGVSCPIAGRICMNQVMVDLGETTQAQVGDDVTLLGRDGAEAITASEWARLLGTITYEVTCGLSARLERVYVD